MNKLKRLSVAVAMVIGTLGVFVNPAAVSAKLPNAKCGLLEPSRRADGSYDVAFWTNEKRYVGKPFRFTLYTEDWMGIKYGYEYYPVAKSTHTKKVKGKAWMVWGMYRGANGVSVQCVGWDNE